MEKESVYNQAHIFPNYNQQPDHQPGSRCQRPDRDPSLSPIKLKDQVEHASPGRHGRDPLALGADSIPVDLATTRVDVDLMRA